MIAQAPVDGHYVSNLLVSFVPMSIGMGLVFVPLTLLATSGVDNDDAGLASGLFNSAQQVGGSLGLAILATLSVDHTTEPASRPVVNTTQATVAGYHVAFLAAAVMMATGAVLLVVLLRRRHLEGLEFDPAALTAAA